MEPSLACEVVRTINESAANVKVSTVIGNDDAATMKALHEEVDEEIEKWSDVSHVKRGL